MAKYGQNGHLWPSDHQTKFEGNEAAVAETNLATHLFSESFILFSAMTLTFICPPFQSAPGPASLLHSLPIRNPHSLCLTVTVFKGQRSQFGDHGSKS